MSIPQVIALMIFAVSLVVSVRDEGKIRKISLNETIARIFIWFLLLWWGGFWG